MWSWSATSQAGTVGTPASSDSYMPRTKWLYERASSVKRSPAAFTAIMPGFARSQMCGNTAWEPSGR